jgi:hypothetical protein
MSFEQKIIRKRSRKLETNDKLAFLSYFIFLRARREKLIASPKGEANNRIRRKKSHVTLSVVKSDFLLNAFLIFQNFSVKSYVFSLKFCEKNYIAKF